MTARRPLPRALRDEPFAVRDAMTRGVDRHRLGRSDLTAPFRGVRTPAVSQSGPGPRTVLETLRAFQPLLARDQAFSHTTAAMVWGIPLPRAFQGVEPIHVVTLRPDAAMRRRGVVGHRGARSTPLERYRGVAVTDPVSTWMALGSLLDVDDLVIAADAVVGELRLARLEHLHGAVARAPGVRGVRNLRAALVDARTGSRSPGETRLRLVLTRGGLPEPERNLDVVVAGRRIACVDLAYPAARLAIEYDSDLHRTDPAAYRKDLTRSERLKDVGWWVIRATAFDVGVGAPEFLARVRRLLRAGSGVGHRPQPRPSEPPHPR
ncbi:endonuclease domain-containing protein [Curtobacterium sp. RRHDQ10]|uniref:endonuclease domain-containing protein n=1 Tax=Curtobacterium phyllosphaerae TaxID=3413379 RepID=UPI003BF44B70